MTKKFRPFGFKRAGALWTLTAVLAAAAMLATSCGGSGGSSTASGTSETGAAGVSESGSALPEGSETTDVQSGQTQGEGSGTANNGKTTGKGGTNGSTSTTKGNDAKPVETKGKTFLIASSLLPTKATKDNYLFERMFFARVAEVEKDLGCTIKVVNTLQLTPDKLAPMIQAGRKVADVLEVELRYMPALMAAGYLRPWSEVPTINPNDAKYTPSYTRLATIAGKSWGLQFMKPPEVRYCVIMNKNLLKQNGVDADGIYNLIDQGKWDYETFRDYAKKTTNASAKRYGMGGRPDYVTEMLLAANNARLVTLDSQGNAAPTYTSANVIEAMNFYNQLINEDKVFMTAPGMAKAETFEASRPNYIDQFIKGNIAFLFEDSWTMNQQIRPKVKNFDYGMIMIPKGPKGTAYVSPSEHARVFTVTSTNNELDFTAKVFNELAKPPLGYSGDQWWLDEVQLDYFQKNDTKSLNIYKKSLESSVWDAGMGIDAVGNGFKRKVVYEPMFWNSGVTPEAAIQSIKGIYDNSIKGVFKK